MDTADYKIGMLKKQQLYQQDKVRLDAVLRTKLGLFGYYVSPSSASASASERADGS